MVAYQTCEKCGQSEDVASYYVGGSGWHCYCVKDCELIDKRIQLIEKIILEYADCRDNMSSLMTAREIDGLYKGDTK